MKKRIDHWHDISSYPHIQFRERFFSVSARRNERETRKSVGINGFVKSARARVVTKRVASDALDAQDGKILRPNLSAIHFVGVNLAKPVAPAALIAALLTLLAEKQRHEDLG